MLARLLGKAVSKTGKKESSEVAKKGTELMGRRDEKFMGMAEEVSPKRLSGPAAKEAEKKGGKAGAAIAAGAAATGVAALASRDKEDKGSSSRGEGKGRSFQEDRPTRDAGRVSAKSEETKSDKKPSTFGAAFKEARSAGKDTFTFEGKKYTTEMASEKKAAPKADKPTAAKPTGVREGRNENIDDDTRKRAMASVAKLAKGGMVKANCGASVPPAQKAKK
jgi:hypothetical protein